MEKILKYFMSVLSLSVFFSCESKSQYADAKDGKSLLWEISGNGLQKPSYIFGTMHLLCAQDAILSNNLKKITDNADEIYFEIDLDNFAELMSGMALGKMKNDTTLHELYTHDEYNRITDFFTKHGMGLQFKLMNNFQPMLVSALVYQAILPCSESDGMEMNIMQEAHSKKKEIKGLETAAFQASLIDSIPYKVQAQELLTSVDSVEESKIETGKMIELYKEQDLDKLLNYTLKTDASTSDVQEIMINRRNRNWAEQFPEITKNKSLLIAVGAGHLGGNKGLLNLLKEKGYTIRAIDNTGISSEQVSR